MKRKNGIIFGAAVITLLMISNATAVKSDLETVVGYQEPQIDAYDQTLVDPDINLESDELSLLYESLQYIDNADVLSLVQAIIGEIENDGLATSEDIQAIEEDLGIFFPVHAGRINSGGSGGNLFAFPGALILMAIYWGPSVVVNWHGYDDDSNPAITLINLFMGYYEGNHEGFIIGYWGFLSCGPYGQGCSPIYGVLGTCTLIIVIPGEGCTSTPSQEFSVQQTQPGAQPSTEPTSELSGSSNIYNN